MVINVNFDLLKSPQPYAWLLSSLKLYLKKYIVAVLWINRCGSG